MDAADSQLVQGRERTLLHHGQIYLAEKASDDTMILLKHDDCSE